MPRTSKERAESRDSYVFFVQKSMVMNELCQALYMNTCASFAMARFSYFFSFSFYDYTTMERLLLLKSYDTHLYTTRTSLSYIGRNTFFHLRSKIPMITHRSNNVQYEVTPPSVEEDLRPQFEFYWTRQKDPHSIRRKRILAKYPEVAKLCGPEWKTKYIASAVVLLQLSIAYALRNTPVLSFKFLALVYVIGATANHNCFLCIHELSHNLAFKKPLHNKLFAIWVNLPIGIPYSASFQPYHQLHHKFLGDEVLDTDLPTPLEAKVLSSLLGKAFFATFQILFYALRPMMVTSIDMTLIHFLNVLVCVLSDFVLLKLGSVNSLWYLILSSFFAGSLHPTAGHFIAEHYLLDPPKHYTQFQDVPPLETYSYYGILNLFTWNVGYHNEHHDFPFIAWSKLPLLRTIAHDFYQPLPKHTSWVRVIVDFIFDENVLMYNRVKRETAKGQDALPKNTEASTK